MFGQKSFFDVLYVENIDRLHAVKTDLVKDYNSKIIQLEIDFKDELELIHKYLTWVSLK